jgi:hypothetical protein
LLCCCVAWSGLGLIRRGIRTRSAGDSQGIRTRSAGDSQGIRTRSAGDHLMCGTVRKHFP